MFNGKREVFEPVPDPELPPGNEPDPEPGLDPELEPLSLIHIFNSQSLAVADKEVSFPSQAFQL